MLLIFLQCVAGAEEHENYIFPGYNRVLRVQIPLTYAGYITFLFARCPSESEACNILMYDYLSLCMATFVHVCRPV
jgi:hypothetical protein